MGTRNTSENRSPGTWQTGCEAIVWPHGYTFGKRLFRKKTGLPRHRSSDRPPVMSGGSGSPPRWCDRGDRCHPACTGCRLWWTLAAAGPRSGAAGNGRSQTRYQRRRSADSCRQGLPPCPTDRAPSGSRVAGPHQPDQGHREDDREGQTQHRAEPGHQPRLPTVPATGRARPPAGFPRASDDPGRCVIAIPLVASSGR